MRRKNIDVENDATIFIVPGKISKTMNDGSRLSKISIIISIASSLLAMAFTIFVTYTNQINDINTNLASRFDNVSGQISQFCFGVNEKKVNQDAHIYFNEDALDISEMIIDFYEYAEHVKMTVPIINNSRYDDIRIFMNCILDNQQFIDKKLPRFKELIQKLLHIDELIFNSRYKQMLEYLMVSG